MSLCVAGTCSLQYSVTLSGILTCFDSKTKEIANSIQIEVCGQLPYLQYILIMNLSQAKEMQQIHVYLLTCMVIFYFVSIFQNYSHFIISLLLDEYSTQNVPSNDYELVTDVIFNSDLHETSELHEKYTKDTAATSKKLQTKIGKAIEVVLGLSPELKEFDKAKHKLK